MENKFEWALFQMCYEVKAGVVQDGKVYSDCLFPEFIQMWNHAFQKENFLNQYDGWMSFSQKIIDQCQETQNQQFFNFAIEVKLWIRNQFNR